MKCTRIFLEEEWKTFRKIIHSTPDQELNPDIPVIGSLVNFKSYTLDQMATKAGHAHLTDFNIATVLDGGKLATSMSGTKPYMAPEIFDCAVDACVGYSFPVDWWSLGICAYEMLSGERPYNIHAATDLNDVRLLFIYKIYYPSSWSKDIVEMMERLLCVHPGPRISTMAELRQVPSFKLFNIEAVLKKQVVPPYTPPVSATPVHVMSSASIHSSMNIMFPLCLMPPYTPLVSVNLYTPPVSAPPYTPLKDHLNCDPTFELEEMIIETKPLHKKKKRLAKQRSLREIQSSLNGEMLIVTNPHTPSPPSWEPTGQTMFQTCWFWPHSVSCLLSAPDLVSAGVHPKLHQGGVMPGCADLQHLPDFPIYNRERELLKRERERKEQEWERELLQAMNNSDATDCSPGNGDNKPVLKTDVKHPKDVLSRPKSRVVQCQESDMCCGFLRESVSNKSVLGVGESSSSAEVKHPSATSKEQIDEEVPTRRILERDKTNTCKTGLLRTNRTTLPAVLFSLNPLHFHLLLNHASKIFYIL
uniref:Protein kinase domain-containing protein n=1 Tax=Timema bartmani TaxID=61472 RepID=A0A7R9EY50_9NEOP|nr:unnamed protein product [Timema bartmani]